MLGLSGLSGIVHDNLLHVKFLSLREIVLRCTGAILDNLHLNAFGAGRAGSDVATGRARQSNEWIAKSLQYAPRQADPFAPVQATNLPARGQPHERKQRATVIFKYLVWPISSKTSTFSRREAETLT